MVERFLGTPNTNRIGRSCLSFEDLNKLLVEVEGIVNARPLTYVYDDLDGINFALTLSHFINGRRLQNTPNSSHFEIVSTHESLTRRSRHQKRLLNQFTETCMEKGLLGQLTWDSRSEFKENRRPWNSCWLRGIASLWFNQESVLESSERKGIVTMEWRQNKSSGRTSSRFKDLVEGKYQALNSYWSEIKRGHVNRTW